MVEAVDRPRGACSRSRREEHTFGKRKSTLRAASRGPAGGGEARFHWSYLRVFFGGPLFFFDGWVDLVPPPLRALLAGFPRELRGNQGPAVAADFLFQGLGRVTGVSEG